MSGSPQQVSAQYVSSQDGGAEASPMTQTPAFFLANYRLGKTLGNGSFGKVKTVHEGGAALVGLHARMHLSGEPQTAGPIDGQPPRLLTAYMAPAAHQSAPFMRSQVKIAEHVLTQHKVAIKILNKRKIKQQDMEEKGASLPWPGSGCIILQRRLCHGGMHARPAAERDVLCPMPA